MPIMPFVLSSVAGCVAGIIILAFTQKVPLADGAAPPSESAARQTPSPATVEAAAISHAAAAEQHNTKPHQATGGNLDEELSKLREEALVNYDEKKYKPARDKLNRLISEAHRRQETIGEGVLLADLCMVDLAAGEIAEGYESGGRAVKILDKTPGALKADLSFALRAFGTISYKKGNLAQAEQLLRRSTTYDQSVFGMNTEEYSIGIARLARVLESEKKYDEAERLYRQAVAISLQCHETGDRHLYLRMMDLSDFLRARNRSKEADELKREAAKIDRK
jgi:tetratricopeptide (TPR) repeat protein